MSQDRRSFLTLTAVGAVATAFGCKHKTTPTPGDLDSGGRPGSDTADTTADTAGETGACTSTRSDIEGPYYRDDPPTRDDFDQYADGGTPMYLEGLVQDQDCAPIEGARIDFWHANPSGAYDLDSSEMRYYGQVTTDASGRYALTTLVPGRYLNGQQYRPAHIHVKIWLAGEEQLTTQLYFEGDKYNEIDPWASEELMVSYAESDGVLVGAFTFTIQR